MKIIVSSILLTFLFLISTEELQAQQQIIATLAGATTNDGFLVQDNTNSPLLRVRGDGMVGIRTANPTVTLTIDGASGERTLIQAGNSSLANGPEIQLGVDDNGNAFIQPNHATGSPSQDLILNSSNAGTIETVLTLKGGGNVGIGTEIPDASAILELSSTTQGILIPQMTKEQRKDIVSPATGLLVFQTNETQGFYYYTGTEWNIIGSSSAPLEIGDYHEGGIIFYLDGTGEHGLISATTDQSTGIQWTDGSYVVTGATGTAVGTGQSNTTTIVSVQGAGNYAAKICDDLVLNSYSDWFLPSKDELNLMYQQRTVIGGFSTSYYWSSSEYDIDDAWAQGFNIGDQNYGSKGTSLYVRAIRQF